MADTSTYPGTLDGDLRALVAPATTPSGFEDFMQLVADAVAKIETELGVNPSGPSATVAAAVAAVAADLAAHEADTADAHDASAISIVDTAGDFTATDVEGALAELQVDHEADAADLAAHAADTTAVHGIADTAALMVTTDVAGPDLIGPPGALAFTPGATSAWYATDEVLGMRFHVPQAKTYRYANFQVGVQSGNIRVSVARLSGAGHLDYTRVMDSGLIACPAAGAIHLDLGATVLSPGEYALCFFADNTTMATQYANIAASNWRWTVVEHAASTGLPASGTFTGHSDRIWVCSLEADI